MRKGQSSVTIQTLINLPNPIMSEQKADSIMQDKITFRRKRVNQLRLRGYTNQEICDTVGCSLSTIEKDLHEINELSRQWFEEEAIKEYCLSLQDSIILYDNSIEELRILYNEIDELDFKLKILTKISEFEERKSQIYLKTKSVQNYLARLIP